MSKPPPSKNRDNQDAATLTQSQPSTSEEIQARVGRPTTVRPDDAPTDDDDDTRPSPRE